MKDERGLFYYPFPQNKQIRMYVRDLDGDTWFRLWNANDADLWEEHGWVPYGAIKKAAGMYRPNTNNFDPNQAYDIEIAKTLIKERK